MKPTQGGIMASLAALVACDDPPHDPTAVQMYSGIRCGAVQPGLYAKVLELVRDSATTTILSERGHGAGACNSRRHSYLGNDPICARSLTVESRALIARRREDIEAERLGSKTDTLNNKVHRANAGNMFCSSLMKDAETERNASGKATGALDSRRVVRQDSAMFNVFNAEEQIAFAEDAARADKKGAARGPGSCE